MSLSWGGGFLNQSDVRETGNIVQSMQKDVNMNSNKLTGLTAPLVDTDASTKKYVDDEITTLTTYVDAEVTTLENATAVKTSDHQTYGTSDVGTSTVTMDTLSVTVATGQRVLLLLHGLAKIDTAGTGINFEIWRSTTKLTDIGAVGDTAGGTSRIPISLHYLDTSPGTGTVTYPFKFLSQDASNDVLYVDMTAIVL